MTPLLRTTTRFAAAAAIAAACAHAGAATPLEIFEKAITGGQATGEMTGIAAERWKSTTRSDSPVLVEAKVISRFKQPGCARLDVVMRQENVPLRNGGTAPYQTGWQINVCVDGSAPEEGKDEGAFARAIKGLEAMKNGAQK